MSKLLVVYWSGTGNTQMMAQAVAEGAKGAGAHVDLLDVGSANAQRVAEYERIAFGCPSMGDEVLEEGEMEPFFSKVEDGLSGKQIALFGSYDWGDGQWMRDWEDRTKGAGAVLCGKGLIANLTPDSNSLDRCRQLGAQLATM